MLRWTTRTSGHAGHRRGESPLHEVGSIGIESKVFYHQAAINGPRGIIVPVPEKAKWTKWTEGKGQVLTSLLRS